MKDTATNEIQQLLRTPPANFTGNREDKVQVAHAALEALRNSGDEQLLFLRSSIELLSSSPTYDNEELLFHCLTGVRQVFLQRWKGFSQTFQNIVRDFFLSIGHSCLPRIIKLACYTIAASFWKRQWSDNDIYTAYERPIEKSMIDVMVQRNPVRLASNHELFQHLESLMQPQSSYVASASQFLAILIGEFMGKSAVHYYLPIEFHKKAHTDFETEGWLDHSLRIVMGSLSHVAAVISSGEHSQDALSVFQLANEIMSWEFGSEAWDTRISGGAKTLLRCPTSWKALLIRADLCRAIFQVHDIVRLSQPTLAHAIRQLILLLASVNGVIFESTEERKLFAQYLMEGTLRLLCVSTLCDNSETSELLDSLIIVTRVISNFKLSVLIQIPSLLELLQLITKTGITLLQANVFECEAVQGDTESMENKEWRDEALAVILEACVILTGDPWLLYSGNEEERKTARSALAEVLMPLYQAFIDGRVKLAKLEEFYATKNAAELDEVREEISSIDLEDEMTSVAAIGRLNLLVSLTCLFSMIQPAFQILQSLWDLSTTGNLQPEYAASLEETRLLTMALGQLLTDDNEGETPAIPDSVIISCQGNPELTNRIAFSVHAVMALAKSQAEKISIDPHNATISPFLAETFLWFFNRWAPAYILPIDSGSTDGSQSTILNVWTVSEQVNEAVSFCTTLCLQYFCSWPQERQIHQKACKLIHQLSNRGKTIRASIVRSSSFQIIATLHCSTAGLGHTSQDSVLHTHVGAYGACISLAMASGYKRLSYNDRARILTTILESACESKEDDSVAFAIFSQCLEIVRSSFQQFADALTKTQISLFDVEAKDLVSLYVALYGGIARCSDIVDSDRIPAFLTPVLQDLSGLMAHYAEDLAICEGLLQFFCDYAERYIAYLNKEQSIALFRASAILLQSYSKYHCSNRVITCPRTSSAHTDTEEEQAYHDVLCAIQLLISLGTKDFLDICTSKSDGVDSEQITNVVFFGIQQIIPLMTQGLLHYPELCSQFFSLVGFMMDTYPDKVCALPFDLFNSLLESMMFGMSHDDTFVAKISLQGISGIAKEHLQSGNLNDHLRNHPEIFDRCSSRLLQEVVFQSIIWDRLEACALALLPLIAINVNRFIAVVNGLAVQLPLDQQPRLLAAFEELVKPEILSKVCTGGYQGRLHRIQFKQDFDVFVKTIHSFLVMK